MALDPNAYIDVATLRSSIGDPFNTQIETIENAINAASRHVDSICNRRFYNDGVTSTRPFDATSTWSNWSRISPMCGTVCYVDDIATTTDLVLSTDPAGNGTYDTTWEVDTDFILRPENQLNGGLAWPYTELVAVGTLMFPRSYRRKAVKVTANWGWPAVPYAVQEATLFLSVNILKRPEAPFGVMGFDQFGSVRVREDATVRELLADYVDPKRMLLVR